MMKPILIYPWIAKLARGSELRYSLRSVEKNFVGDVSVWVVGDCPDWYVGNYLPVSEYDSKLILPRQDRAKKLWRVVKEPTIGDEFLWMMDDIYFIRKVDIDLFRNPWNCGTMTPEKLADWRPKSEWERQKKLTWEILADNGRPLFDFATHLPHVYRKSSLQRLFERYFLWDAPFVDDILYGNEFIQETKTFKPKENILEKTRQEAETPEDTLQAEAPTWEANWTAERILYRELRRPTLSGLKRRAERGQSLVFNHVDFSYTPIVERFLEEKFPHASSWEK